MAPEGSRREFAIPFCSRSWFPIASLLTRSPPSGSNDGEPPTSSASEHSICPYPSGRFAGHEPPGETRDMQLEKCATWAGRNSGREDLNLRPPGPEDWAWDKSDVEPCLYVFRLVWRSGRCSRQHSPWKQTRTRAHWAQNRAQFWAKPCRSFRGRVCTALGRSKRTQVRKIRPPYPTAWDLRTRTHDAPGRA